MLIITNTIIMDFVGKIKSKSSARIVLDKIQQQIFHKNKDNRMSWHLTTYRDHLFKIKHRGAIPKEV